MKIDIYTLTLVFGITYLIQSIVFSLQFIHKHYNGVGWWLLWCLSEAFGFGFAYLRVIPEFEKLSILLQNSLITLGAVFLCIGVSRFFNKRVRYNLIFSLYAFYVLANAVFVFVYNSVYYRGIFLNLSLAVLLILTSFILFKNKFKAVKLSTIYLSILFLYQGLFFAYRVVMFISNASADDFFSTTGLNSITFLNGITVSLLWAFGILTMLNQRLNFDARKANEHFEIIFSMNPDAMLITTLNDEKIVNANQGFIELTGFKVKEAIGKTTIELPFWKNPEDRDSFIQTLIQSGHCNNIEINLLRKDSSVFVGLLNARIISIDGDGFIISSYRNISERKKAENELIELKNNLEELVRMKTQELQKRVDELESFYNATINREIRMKELKEEVKRLKEELSKNINK